MAKSSKKRRSQTSDATKRTKKQIALSRKETRQKRIIWLCVGVVALLILIVLAMGLIREFVLKPATPVATVNGTKIRADDFQDLLQYRRYNTHINILNLENELNSLDRNDQANQFLISFYEQQLEQLQSSLSGAAEGVLDELIDDALIREKAEQSGIAVTDEEVAQSISEDLARAASPPPQTPVTDTEQTLAPTPVPQERLDEIYQNALKSMGLADKEFQTIVKRSLYRIAVEDALASEVVTTGLVVHVQLIQTDTEEQAVVALERIDGGEDFAVVAREVSTDTLTAEGGGDLGWVTTGQMSSRYGEDLENTVFGLDVGQLQIVQSNGKYYVVFLADRDENGPLPAEVVGNLQRSALSDWLVERKASPDVQIERLLGSDQIPPDPFASSGALTGP